MENSIALYRKYRPQNFNEVVGQEYIVQTLKNSIANESVSHAYLFSGPRGSGKTTLARIFAKTINCQSQKNGQPCNKCDSCVEITASKSLDLIEIDAASHTGVDDVRELIDGIRFAPVKSKYKIFIIDECHQLSKPAFNALLKTLEEPPAHAIFMLATTEAHKMLPTVISRCQRFDFRRLNSFEIIEKLEYILKKEKLTFEKEALQLIALNARGSFRDAESLLDKCINFTGPNKKLEQKEVKDILGVVDVGQIAVFLDFIIAKNTQGAISFINTVMKDGIDIQEFSKTLIFYLRSSLLLKINPGLLNQENAGFSGEEIQKMQKHKRVFVEDW